MHHEPYILFSFMINRQLNELLFRSIENSEFSWAICIFSFILPLDYLTRWTLATICIEQGFILLDTKSVKGAKNNPASYKMVTGFHSDCTTGAIPTLTTNFHVISVLTMNYITVTINRIGQRLVKWLSSWQELWHHWM